MEGDCVLRGRGFMPEVVGMSWMGVWKRMGWSRNGKEGVGGGRDDVRCLSSSLSVSVSGVSTMVCLGLADVSLSLSL